jgi:hypothetical protein
VCHSLPSTYPPSFHQMHEMILRESLVAKLDKIFVEHRELRANKDGVFWESKFQRLTKSVKTCSVTQSTDAKYSVNIWSVTSNSLCWSPVNLSTYRANIYRRMLHRIFYIVGESEVHWWLTQSVLSPFL